jgi:hypothetical protein
MFHIAFQQMKRVCWIAIETDVDKELSQFMRHLISGSFSHRRFPDSIILEQIQSDGSQLESGVLYAVDSLQVLKALRTFDVDEEQSEAMAFHLFHAHRVQSSDDSGSISSRFPHALFVVNNIVMRDFSVEILSGIGIISVQFEESSHSRIFH